MTIVKKCLSRIFYSNMLLLICLTSIITTTVHAANISNDSTTITPGTGYNTTSYKNSYLLISTDVLLNFNPTNDKPNCSQDPNDPQGNATVLLSVNKCPAGYLPYLTYNIVSSDTALKCGDSSNGSGCPLKEMSSYYLHMFVQNPPSGSTMAVAYCGYVFYNKGQQNSAQMFVHYTLICSRKS